MSRKCSTLILVFRNSHFQGLKMPFLCKRTAETWQKCHVLFWKPSRVNGALDQRFHYWLDQLIVIVVVLTTVLCKLRQYYSTQSFCSLMFFQGIVVTLVFLLQHAGPCKCIGVCDWWGGYRRSHRGSTWWCPLHHNSYCVSLKCSTFNSSCQNYTLLHWSVKIVDQLVAVELCICFPLWCPRLCSVVFDPSVRVVHTQSLCSVRCWDSYWRRSRQMR